MQLDIDNGDFTNVSDEELADMCRKDERAFCVLLSRYFNTINIKANAMSKKISADKDDLFQEGIIGLMNAVRTYKNDKGTKFSSYSNVCISNKMKSAVAKNCQENLLDIDLLDEVSDVSDMTPENILLEKENIQEIEDNLCRLLSDKELEIFRLFLKGSSYTRMARQLNISPKTVDNALQRVRRKLKSVWRADCISD